MSEMRKRYSELRSAIDELSNKLFKMHHSHVECKKGCDLCCMDYQIFPVEFDSIKEAIKNEEIQTGTKENGSCIFLKDHECQIYEHRPIICRTHGLPLLFMNDEQWELSACELNFTNFDDEEFTAENTFPQDKFNSLLFVLNKNYLNEIKSDHGEFDLIPIHKLID
ncbi:YkgJ family cysteine cluster protein [Sunxiuqinia sp. A32]|uniref:YkgJ family cysteine cluster protein n=1 Tax=Sunxiuqinia sp. A32 TaxID=3461496 RepID=UPI0040456A89